MVFLYNYNLENYEKIKSSEIYEKDAQFVILENKIVIKAFDECHIYDKNTLNFINTIKLEDDFGIMYKYDNQYLIIISKYEEENDLLI